MPSPPPSRLRYEQNNPPFNMRIPAELLLELQEFLAETGMKKPEFIRAGLRALKDERSQTPTKTNHTGGLAEQFVTFLRLLEQGDPDAIRVIAMVEQLNAAKLIG